MHLHLPYQNPQSFCVFYTAITFIRLLFDVQGLQVVCGPSFPHTAPQLLFLILDKVGLVNRFPITHKIHIRVLATRHVTPSTLSHSSKYSPYSPHLTPTQPHPSNPSRKHYDYYNRSHMSTQTTYSTCQSMLTRCTDVVNSTDDVGCIHRLSTPAGIERLFEHRTYVDVR